MARWVNTTNSATIYVSSGGSTTGTNIYGGAETVYTGAIDSNTYVYSQGDETTSGGVIVGAHVIQG